MKPSSLIERMKNIARISQKTYGSFRLSHPSHGQTGGSKDPCPDNMPTLEMDSGDITDAIAKAEQANLEQMSKD